MKQIKLITLAISLVLLTAWIAAAFGPPEDRGPFGVKYLQMMQAIPNLTDEQSTAVEDMFADVRKNTQVILFRSERKKIPLSSLKSILYTIQARLFLIKSPTSLCCFGLK